MGHVADRLRLPVDAHHVRGQAHARRWAQAGHRPSEPDLRDKPGGLVVDYIGIAESLQAALRDYTDRDRAQQEVGAPIDEALALLEEKVEVLGELLYGCPWREALDSGSDRAKVEAIMEALNHLLGGADLELVDRFLHHTRVAGQAFTLAVSSLEAMRFRDDLAFFQRWRWNCAGLGRMRLRGLQMTSSWRRRSARSSPTR